MTDYTISPCPVGHFCPQATDAPSAVPLGLTEILKELEVGHMFSLYSSVIHLSNQNPFSFIMPLFALLLSADDQNKNALLLASLV